MSERRYTLTLTEAQADVLVDALDAYMRIGIGQFGIVAEVYDPMRQIGGAFRAHLEHARSAVGFAYGASRGIHNPAVHDRFRVACGVHDVVRHRLAWDRNPSGGCGVAFYEPHRIGDEPMATIERKDGAP